jgi:hypothetical protein
MGSEDKVNSIYNEFYGTQSFTSSFFLFSLNAFIIVALIVVKIISNLVFYIL